MKGEKRKVKKELIDLLEKDCDVNIEELDDNMECVFGILVTALKEYYKENGEGEIPWSENEFISCVLTDFANFIISGFMEYVEEGEDIEYGEE